MDPAVVLRAIRRARRLSQRELAAVAELPLSTIDRIECGRTARPSLHTIERILHAIGYQLVIANNVGRPLALDEVHARIHDRGGRQFPAHLDAHRLTWGSAWAGWVRAPYYGTNPPEWIYESWLRSRRRFAPWDGDRRWDDAT